MCDALLWLHHISGCKLSEFERVTALKVYNWFANRRKEMKRRANIGEDVIPWTLSISKISTALFHLIWVLFIVLNLIFFWWTSHQIMESVNRGTHPVGGVGPSLCWCAFPLFFYVVTTRSCHFGEPWHWGSESKLPIQRRGGRNARVCRSGQSSFLWAGKSTWCYLKAQYGNICPFYTNIFRNLFTRV